MAFEYKMYESDGNVDFSTSVPFCVRLTASAFVHSEMHQFNQHDNKNALILI